MNQAGTSAAGTSAVEGIFDSRILVVDDNSFNRTIIGAMLEEAGYKNIAFATNGFQALDAVAADTPDLVLLDIMMPGMDGFEVCRRVREVHAKAELPILVQTALSSMDDRNRAFDAGTTDLIAKPIERQEMLARVRIHLENRILIRRHRQFRERVEGELAIARGMYDHLLPTPLEIDAVAHRCGVRVRAHLRLGSELGGTVWGIVPLDDLRFAVFMLGLDMRGVSAALNAFRMHTLIHEMKALAALPAALLTALNGRAAALLEPGDTVRLLCGVVDPRENTFQYSVAGALPPRLMRRGLEYPVAGDVAGPAIGASADAVYRSSCLEYLRGDILMLGSGRLPDVGDAGGGEDPALVALTAALSDSNPSAAFHWLVEGIDSLDGRTLEDDVAVIWLDRTDLDEDEGDDEEAGE